MQNASNDTEEVGHMFAPTAAALWLIGLGAFALCSCALATALIYRKRYGGKRSHREVRDALYSLAILSIFAMVGILVFGEVFASDGGGDAAESPPAAAQLPPPPLHPSPSLPPSTPSNASDGSGPMVSGSLDERSDALSSADGASAFGPISLVMVIVLGSVSLLSGTVGGALGYRQHKRDGDYRYIRKPLIGLFTLATACALGAIAVVVWSLGSVGSGATTNVSYAVASPPAAAPLLRPTPLYPPPPPFRPPPSHPPGATAMPVVRAQLTIAGTLDGLSASARDTIRTGLRRRFSTAANVVVAFSAASINVDVALVYDSDAAAQQGLSDVTAATSSAEGLATLSSSLGDIPILSASPPTLETEAIYSPPTSPEQSPPAYPSPFPSPPRQLPVVDLGSGSDFSDLGSGIELATTNSTLLPEHLADVTGRLTLGVALACSLSGFAFLSRQYIRRLDVDSASAVVACSATICGAIAGAGLVLVACVATWWAVSTSDPIRLEYLVGQLAWQCEGSGCWHDGLTLGLFFSWSGMLLLGGMCCACAACLASSHHEIEGNGYCRDRYETRVLNEGNRILEAFRPGSDTAGKYDDDDKDGVSTLGLLWAEAVELNGAVTLKELLPKDVTGRSLAEDKVRAELKTIEVLEDVELGLCWAQRGGESPEDRDILAISEPGGKKLREALQGGKLSFTKEELKVMFGRSMPDFKDFKNTFIKVGVDENHQPILYKPVQPIDELVRSLSQPGSSKKAGGKNLLSRKETNPDQLRGWKRHHEKLKALRGDYVLPMDGKYYKPVSKLEVQEKAVMGHQDEADLLYSEDSHLRFWTAAGCCAFAVLLLVGWAVCYTWWHINMDSWAASGGTSNVTAVDAERLRMSMLDTSSADIVHEFSYLTTNCANDTNRSEEALSPMASFFFDEHCLIALDNQTGGCSMEKVNAFIEYFAEGWRIESEVGNMAALVATVILMQLGGIPRPRDFQGKIFWGLWMLCQVCQLLIITFALVLVICGYSVIQLQLYSCMTQIHVFGAGPFSLINVISVASFAFHPLILTKLLTLLVYCSACFHGIIAWEDSNPSEGFGFSMLAGQVFGKLFARSLAALLYLWGVTWVLSGGVFFSLVYLPILLCVGVGWLGIEVVLYVMMRFAKLVDQHATLTLRQRRDKRDKIKKEEKDRSGDNHPVDEFFKERLAEGGEGYIGYIPPPTLGCVWERSDLKQPPANPFENEKLTEKLEAKMREAVQKHGCEWVSHGSNKPNKGTELSDVLLAAQLPAADRPSSADAVAAVSGAIAKKESAESISFNANEWAAFEVTPAEYLKWCASSDFVLAGRSYYTPVLPSKVELTHRQLKSCDVTRDVLWKKGCYLKAAGAWFMPESRARKRRVKMWGAHLLKDDEPTRHVKMWRAHFLKNDEPTPRFEVLCFGRPPLWFCGVWNKVVRIFQVPASYLLASLWWLGDNERPRGNQISTAFGISLSIGAVQPLLNLWSRTRRICGAPANQTGENAAHLSATPRENPDQPEPEEDLTIPIPSTSDELREQIAEWTKKRDAAIGDLKQAEKEHKDAKERSEKAQEAAKEASVRAESATKQRAHAEQEADVEAVQRDLEKHESELEEAKAVTAQQEGVR